LQTMVKSKPPWRNIRRYSHEAMATVFEILIHEQDQSYARQAAWAGFSLLEQLEGELSRYLNNSDISRINRAPAGAAVTVSSSVFECLEQCVQLYHQTGRTFDITAGALTRLWQRDKNPPSAKEIERAQASMGAHRLGLDPVNSQVIVPAGGLSIDLGGFGKGFAVDRLSDLLREWELDCFLIHGGASSVYAENPPGAARGWPVTLSDPDRPDQTLARIFLNHRALGGSGLKKGRHIVDPRTGYPVSRIRAAWAMAQDAATADALSTAFMILDGREVRRYCEQQESGAFLIRPGREEVPVRLGAWPGWEQRSSPAAKPD